MKQTTKTLFEKMTDYKRFGTVLLAIGVFFYLGVILPTEKNPVDINKMMIASISFIAVSVFFYVQSKRIHLQLMDLEDGGDDYQNK